MTAVLNSPALFLDRPAKVGDRVHCGAGNSWIVLIGRVVDVADPLTGRMRITEEQTGSLVYVDREKARVYAPAFCPTCGDGVPSHLATCRKRACLAEDIRANAALDRWEDV